METKKIEAPKAGEILAANDDWMSILGVCKVKLGIGSLFLLTRIDITFADSSDDPRLRLVSREKTSYVGL